MFVDHINGIKTDNRIANLRLATRGQNGHNASISYNNTSGVKGVCWCNGKWLAQLMFNGNKIAKYFTDLDNAKLWIEGKRKEKHKEFANHGKLPQ